MRRVVTVCFLIGMIVWSGSSVFGQFSPLNRRTAEIDRGVQQAMDEAQECIKQQQFTMAVARLQAVLDHSEDYFLSKDFRGKSGPAISVRAQTNRILADLPPDGRAAYELQFGSTARALLNDAFATNDREKLIEVVSRFQMTAAGFEAMQVMLASALDHDRLIEAAQLAETMAARRTIDPTVATGLSLRAAFAWHLAGQSDRGLSMLNTLKASQNQTTWQFGGKQVKPFEKDQDAPAWMATHFGSPLQLPARITVDWRMPRGGVTGNESAMEASPAGGGAWTISPLKYSRIALNADTNEQHKEVFEQLTIEVEQSLRKQNRLTQPASRPLVVGDVVVYRTLNDVTAVSLKTGQLLWRSSVTDAMVSWLLQSPTAFSDAMGPSSPITFRGYLRYKLFRDQISGALTSDGENVYAIEESDSQFNPLRPRIRQQFGLPFIPEASNKLIAYQLHGGRLMWEIGGMRGTPPAELSGLFFLGPPLPYDGRLYCLTEAKNEIQLLALRTVGTSVQLEWSQSLITVNDGAAIASPRRLAGLAPVVHDGIIICPTARGAVVAFDLSQRQLRWGYTYEPINNRIQQEYGEMIVPFSIDEEEGRWLDGGPILAQGRVLLTPRDSTELHCVNLADGKLIWKRPREQGLYIAAVENNQVVVVGRSQIMAYSLSDGSEAWPEPIEIPEPSGRGIREGSRYLLPLSSGEIATVDFSTRRILGRSKLPDSHIPGNLAIGGGALVSCGTHDVVGFSSLPDVEERINRQLAKNPQDAEALALRGELRLHRGDEKDAIADLRESLRQEPQPRVSHILAATMLDVLRNDSAGLMKAAKELDSLIDEPQQRIEFLRLYAKSLGDSGDSVGAVEQLFRLSRLPQSSDELILRGPGEFISFEQNIRSQLFAIYDAANSEKRLEISRAFARELENSITADVRESRLDRLIQLVVGHPAADPSLKQLAASNDEIFKPIARIRLLERLTASRDRSVAAFAVAKLASWYVTAGLPRAARPWIETLLSDYPMEMCLDGKTGRQLSDEWLSRDDIRQAKIESAVWPAGDVEVKRTQNSIGRMISPVEIVTHVGHHFSGWTFEVDQAIGSLNARDPSLRIVWRLSLGNLPEFLRMQPLQLHIRGTVLAFLSGTHLVVMRTSDPNSAPQIQFEKTLRSAIQTDRRVTSLQSERRLLPNGRVVQLPFESNGTTGFLIGLSDEAVFYQLDNRLIAADLETGQPLWYRRGAVFARSNATVDKILTLHTANNGAILLQPMDGTLLHSRQGNIDDMPLWFRGTRRLSQRAVAQDQQILELRDFEDDKVVWQIEGPSGTIEKLVDSQEIAVLKPSGKLSIVSIASGQTRVAVESPIIRPLGSGGVLSVQRYGDTYVVVGGVSSKQVDNRNVAPIDPNLMGQNSFTVDGFAFALAQSDGKILWSVPIEQLAFDFSQPANLPVTLLAARLTEFERIGLALPKTRLSMLMLDKRTGNVLLKREESLMPSGRGAQFTPLIEDHRLLIDFQGWNFEVKFNEKDK